MAPHEEEAELLRKAREGSVQAQEELTRRTQPGLRSFLAKKIGVRLARTTPVADVEQETYLRTLQALPELDALSSLEAFRALLQRRALWIIYSAGAGRDRYAGESALSNPIAERILNETGASGSGTVTRADEARWLEAQVDRLPEKAAEVLRMRLLGADWSEVSRELALSEGTVRKRYLRGLSELRKIIRPREE